MQHNNFRKLILSMLEKNGMKHKLYETQLKDDWAKIIGGDIASYTRDIKIVQDRLYLYIDSAPLKQNLHYNRAEILQIINKALGERYITELIIK